MPGTARSNTNKEGAMSVPAGWYDDGSGRQRWWDGQQWTEHFAPEQAAAADAAAANPATETRATETAADAAGTVDGQDDLDATVRREDVLAADAGAGEPAVQDAAPYAAPVAPAEAAPYTPPAAAPYGDPNATAAYPAAPGYPGGEQAPGAAPYGTAPYGAGYAPPAAGAAPAGPLKRPVLGFVGLGLAVLGTILACIPPILTGFGFFLLFAAFVVSLIAIFMKTKKWPAIAGLALSVVGGIIGAIVTVLFFVTLANDVANEFPSDFPTSEVSEEPSGESTDPGASGERPTADEVAVGIQEILSTTGQEDTLTQPQLECYAQYMVDSDIPDATLQVIASGEEALTDPDAVSAFSEKLLDGASTCAMQ